MIKHLVRRLLLTIPLLFGISVITFLLLRVSGGDPATLVAGPIATQQQIAHVRSEMGLDKSLTSQYGKYLTNVVHRNFGTSWQTQRTVSYEIRNRIGASIELWSLGVALSFVLGLLGGCVAAFLKDSLSDHLVRIFSLLGLSVPIFLLGLFLAYFVYFKLHLAAAPYGQLDATAPIPRRLTGAVAFDSLLSRNWPALWNAIRHLILPVLTIGLVSGATITKQARTALLEALTSPAVRFAQACGVPRLRVYRLIVRLALPTIIGYAALVASLDLGGSSLVELVYSWGGFGQFALESVPAADFSVVQAYVLLIGLGTIAIYMAADIVIAFLDPRIDYT